jgi:hypothetical protein
MISHTRAAELAAKLIESTATNLCRAHYEMGPQDEWFTGGPSHNDDRLTAEVVVDGIKVSDGNQSEYYTGPLEDAPIRDYVRDWLTDVWANA